MRSLTAVVAVDRVPLGPVVDTVRRRLRGWRLRRSARARLAKLSVIAAVFPART
jgi:hypothetical protein